ncbi:uncharacterized protein YjaZ [Arthrobacter stackebrandtii]|uniref:Uncharacterized protein YjaZ n=1 Tax=Arthrobacter stackebrandtii TaxID=272161 RepID=A0ABS4YXI9_9MICC|nr:DUF2268 domain-containing putative Zn-dependent protease [Arthrobacter stackebrandtii]MBP2413498.1 uncharacterized protein YjaZ [Arthrobacter stackebrandtii]PYH00662.1 peptidase [Arthrobacter stackebrandtii]
MTISVIDSASRMRRLLAATPDDRAELVREMWFPLAGMYHFIPGGVDMATVHQQNFGFDWEGATEPIQEALERLVEADAWSRITKALESGVDALRSANPGIEVPDLQVILVLGDPANKHFVDEIQGLSAFGGISGYITITVWPTPQVLGRLEAIAVHELHHNVRYSPGGVVWDPMTVSLGEQVISEGLADVFAAELYGDRGYTHFVSESTHNDDDVLTKVASGLHITGMQNFTAWVHGDASARLLGAEPVGLPTGAGYAAGTRLVRAYLDATATTSAQSIAVPVDEVLRIAAPQLGLRLNQEY